MPSRHAHAALAVLLLATACTRPAGAQDAVAPAVSERPQRIVSLVPSLTEALFALGAGDRVVGVSDYCTYPPAATTRTSIGGVLPNAMNLEAIVALRPDLVLSAGEGQEPAVEALRGLGLRAEYARVRGLDEVPAMVERLGELIGEPARAAALAQRLRRQVAAVVARVAAVAPEPPPRVFWEIWPAPLMTAGPDSFIGELIDRAGGANLFPEIGEDYPQVSAEEVVRRDPQVILWPQSRFTPDRVQGLAERPGWANIAAVRRGRVHAVDDEIVHRPGPRVAQALWLVATAIYPELATNPPAILATARP